MYLLYLVIIYLFFTILLFFSLLNRCILCLILIRDFKQLCITFHNFSYLNVINVTDNRKSFRQNFRWCLCVKIVVYVFPLIWKSHVIRFGVLSHMASNFAFLRVLSEPCFPPLGNTESQAVFALPAEGWPIRSCGRICLQWLPPQAVHAERNLPHHIPSCRWVNLAHLCVKCGHLWCTVTRFLLF